MFVKIKVDLKCEKHGHYTRLLLSLVRGYYNTGFACPRCSKENAKRTADYSYRIERISSILNWLDGSPDKEKLLNGEFNFKSKAHFVCPKHGIFYRRILTQVTLKNCPFCSVEFGYKRIKYKSSFDYTPLVKWGVVVNPADINANEKVEFSCSIHGKFYRTIRDQLKFDDCPKCSRIRKTRNTALKGWLQSLPKNVLSRLQTSSKYNDFLDLKITTAQKVDFACPEHGTYYSRINDVIHSKESLCCPVCSEKIRKTEFINTFREKNPIQDWFLQDLEGSPDRKDVIEGNLTLKDSALFVCKEHGLYRQNISHHRYDGASCPICNPPETWHSHYEYDLAKALDKYNPIIGCRNQIVSPVSNKFMELDLFFPEYSVAVEVNGLYFHSIEHMLSSRCYNSEYGKENYHRMKYDLCKKRHIQLITLWEDTLRDKWDLAVSLVESKLVNHGAVDNRIKIYGRMTSVKEVSTEKAKLFLNENHIQGYARGECYGLYFEGLLVSVVSVKNAQSNTQDIGKLIVNRYAELEGYHVLGGFNKLIKFLKQLYNKTLVSYADLEVSSGDLYKNNGWKLVSEVAIDYKYVYNETRYHKFNFRLDDFKNKPNLLYKEGLHERELAELNGLTRVYDCGKLKFEL